MNLIGNAFKFTFKGFIKVKITQLIVEEENAVKITIEDTGIGIKEEERPKLFKLFSVLDTTKEMNTTGTGFGLYQSNIYAKELGFPDN